ncbi:hypothetical protein [Streptomyces sp. NPDC006195]|uniref:hypothetical protein n=1 Tax=unclassified Streptomyces TaxID=2593676 RepID=UPI0033A5F5E4
MRSADLRSADLRTTDLRTADVWTTDVWTTDLWMTDPRSVAWRSLRARWPPSPVRPVPAGCPRPGRGSVSWSCRWGASAGGPAVCRPRRRRAVRGRASVHAGRIPGEGRRRELRSAA